MVSAGFYLGGIRYSLRGLSYHFECSYHRVLVKFAGLEPFPIKPFNKRNGVTGGKQDIKQVCFISGHR